MFSVHAENCLTGSQKHWMNKDIYSILYVL